ncbi:MAG TPA: hypothetical protein VGR06_43690 [Actinophytocola sp.]|nr:hypothetical protein [Actinophytocola sp.]
MADEPDVRCARCNRSRTNDPPLVALAWVVENGVRGRAWLCPSCARAHVRDIEGKLPDEYW